MLRWLYIALLRLHPKRFRERFQAEMLSIFDGMAERSTRAPLLLDAFISMLRQWAVRPENFQAERLGSAASVDGTPVFYTVGNFQPRTSALVHGAVLTLVGFFGVCLLLGYNWSHPVLIAFSGMQLDDNSSSQLMEKSKNSSPFPVGSEAARQRRNPSDRGARRRKAFRPPPQTLSLPNPQVHPINSSPVVGRSLLVPLMSPDIESTKSRPAYTTRFLTVAKDVQLEVLDWGGSGRALVLLAGLGNTAHVFDNFAPKLATYFRVYGITRRGFGASSAPPDHVGNYSADRLADDVLAVIDSLRLARPLLVGHSIAGEELSSIGSRFPRRVGGLVYLDAGYGYAFYDASRGDLIRDSLELQRNLEQFMPFSRLEKRTQVAGGLLATLPRFESQLQAYQKDMEFIPDSEAALFPVSAVIAGERKYAKIQSPILAIFALPHDLSAVLQDNPAARVRLEASYNAMTEAQAEAFQRGLPGARVIRLAHASHFVFQSNEAQVLEEIRSFANSLP